MVKPVIQPGMAIAAAFAPASSSAPKDQKTEPAAAPAAHQTAVPKKQQKTKVQQKTRKQQKAKKPTHRVGTAYGDSDSESDKEEAYNERAQFQNVQQRNTEVILFEQLSWLKKQKDAARRQTLLNSQPNPSAATPATPADTKPSAVTPATPADTNSSSASITLTMRVNTPPTAVRIIPASPQSAASPTAQTPAPVVNPASAASSAGIASPTNSIDSQNDSEVAAAAAIRPLTTSPQTAANRTSETPTPPPVTSPASAASTESHASTASSSPVSDNDSEEAASASDDMSLTPESSPSTYLEKLVAMPPAALPPRASGNSSALFQLGKQTKTSQDSSKNQESPPLHPGIWSG